MKNNVRWVVVGLTNPSPEYAGTRHNIGSAFVRWVASQWSANSWTREGDMDVTLAEDWNTLLAVPRTYMNLNGAPTAKLIKAMKVPIGNLVVVHDDLERALGRISLTKGGSHRGHNGVRSVTEKLSSSDFVRLRLGIDRPTSRDPKVVADYVVDRFSPKEREMLPEMFEIGLAALEKMIKPPVVKSPKPKKVKVISPPSPLIEKVVEELSAPNVVDSMALTAQQVNPLNDGDLVSLDATSKGSISRDGKS